MRRSYGFSVVEINQASGMAEIVAEDISITAQEAAERTDAMRELAKYHGRRERYVVVELIGVDDD